MKYCPRIYMKNLSKLEKLSKIIFIGRDNWRCYKWELNLFTYVQTMQNNLWWYICFDGAFIMVHFHNIYNRRDIVYGILPHSNGNTWCTHQKNYAKISQDCMVGSRILPMFYFQMAQQRIFYYTLDQNFDFKMWRDHRKFPMGAASMSR